MVEFVDIDKIKLDEPPYVDPSKIRKLDDLPQKAAIHLLRLVNHMRAKGEVDEFIDFVLVDSVLKKIPSSIGIIEQCTELIKVLERKEASEEKKITIEYIYKIFITLTDFIFIRFSSANYFQFEDEILSGKIIYEEISPEVNPDKVRELAELTKKDAIRLLRIVNSFRRKDIVDTFLQIIGDFENIYYLFQLYVGYIFHEYVKANYFFNEAELDPKAIAFQKKEFGRPTKFEGAFVKQ